MDSYLSSNRTFMELKYSGEDDQTATIEGSNRTFMELKLLQSTLMNLETVGSNRTFMELKYSQYKFIISFSLF